jgi:hypothetical protein
MLRPAIDTLVSAAETFNNGETKGSESRQPLAKNITKDNVTIQ